MNKAFIIQQWRKGFDTHAIMTQHNAIYKGPIKEHQVLRVIHAEREQRRSRK